jgi:hypothetical protein
LCQPRLAAAPVTLLRLSGVSLMKPVRKKALELVETIAP